LYKYSQAKCVTIFIRLTKNSASSIIYFGGYAMGLKVTIRERAEKRGIKNANQLGVALEVAPNVSARLWDGTFKKIGMNTFEKLCEVLACQPSALFKYEHD